ncbi:MAG: bifunctional phosphoribosyl-AMP cyclohydrolase/phosphoribosyl-ATP diphosphatase HisIE [Immundisolibacterales bacterium]|nr:bifunctional phosphoribosyl-AMP cyclohydrolase/phosphoribosyl-ATP diphosphatase HisIE [Immundisolibacterales bacterium]
MDLDVSANAREGSPPPAGACRLDSVRWNADGLVPAIVQDAVRGDVLMLAWMSRESLALTLEEGRTVFWSRSRGTIWRKGETSGNVQRVRGIRLDCDGDALLVAVDQVGGGACHTGRRSCFFQPVEGGDPRAAAEGDGRLPSGALESLARRLEERKSADPGTSWTARLYARGLDAILKKVGEEATETVLAAKDGEPSRVVAETADLWYHTMVMLANFGLGPEDVLQELDRRAGRSGLAEKATRAGPD